MQSSAYSHFKVNDIYVTTGMTVFGWRNSGFLMLDSRFSISGTLVSSWQDYSTNALFQFFRKRSMVVYLFHQQVIYFVLIVINEKRLVHA